MSELPRFPLQAFHGEGYDIPFSTTDGDGAAVRIQGGVFEYVIKSKLDDEDADELLRISESVDVSGTRINIIETGTVGNEVDLGEGKLVLDEATINGLAIGDYYHAMTFLGPGEEQPMYIFQDKLKVRDGLV